MLREGMLTNNLTRFTIDGIVKTPHPPHTGRSLYELAGEPKELHSNGVKVERNEDKYTITEGQEFVTVNDLTVKPAFVDESKTSETKPASPAVVQVFEVPAGKAVGD